MTLSKFFSKPWGVTYAANFGAKGNGPWILLGKLGKLAGVVKARLPSFSAFYKPVRIIGSA
jgi:hypothetical protein